MKSNTLILAASTIVIVILLVVIGRFFLAEDDFIVTNPAWNGISELPAAGNVSYLYTMADLSGLSSNSTLLIIGPTQNYTEDEAAQVLMFMQSGGRVIVMDDFGTSDSLLQNINSPIRIDQKSLCQDDSFYRSPAFPIIEDLKNESLTAGVRTLEFNHPAPLVVSDSATVLATTSSIAWIDSNGNSRIDSGETFGKYPMIATASYGAGGLVVVGDADLFINGMLNAEDNGILLANLLSVGPAYIDVAHGRDVPILAQAYFLVRQNLLAQFLCIGLICLSGYLIDRRKDIFGSPGQSKSEKYKPPDAVDRVISYMRVKLPLRDEEAKELKKKLGGK